MNLIQLHNATIAKISTLSDKCIRIQLDCRELPPEQMAELMTAYMKGTEGFEITDTVDGGKSQSQRLKNVLYRFWEQSKTDEDSSAFYSRTMEKIIEHYKEKLN